MRGMRVAKSLDVTFMWKSDGGSVWKVYMKTPEFSDVYSSHVFAIKIEITPQIWLKYRKMSKLSHDSFHMEPFGEYVQTTFETKYHAGKEFVHMRLHFLF